MSILAEIAAEVGVTLELRGGLELVWHADANRFLDACDQARVRILGVEGFTCSRGTITPRMDLIADFSGLSTPREVSISAARQVVRHADSDAGVCFEFLVSRDPT